MYVTWKMILIGFLAVCAGITSVCTAAVWISRIIEGMRKPSKTVNGKLENDNKRIAELEKAIQEINIVQPMLLRSMYVILQHMRTNNSTGEIAKQEQAISDYLFNR